MILVDTSVVVAGFASWHEGHRAAAAALALKPRVPAHVLLEAYSVLTRLPPPHRAPADLVSTFLADRFAEAPLTLPPRAHRELVEACVRVGLLGGAIYDALVAATAKQTAATIITRDVRARLVYDQMQAKYEFVGA